jgi:hypothetical protein
MIKEVAKIKAAVEAHKTTMSENGLVYSSGIELKPGTYEFIGFSDEPQKTKRRDQWGTVKEVNIFKVTLKKDDKEMSTFLDWLQPQIFVDLSNGQSEIKRPEMSNDDILEAFATMNGGDKFVIDSEAVVTFGKKLNGTPTENLDKVFSYNGNYYKKAEAHVVKAITKA